jgi:hypothetical protein
MTEELNKKRTEKWRNSNKEKAGTKGNKHRKDRDRYKDRKT